MDNHIIQFGALNKYLFIPFLLALSQILLNVLDLCIKDGNNQVNNQVIDTFSNTLGQMSIIIIPQLKIFSSKMEKFEEKKVSSNGCLHYSILCFLLFIYIVLVIVNAFTGKSESQEFKSIHVSGLCTNESFEILFICLVSMCLLHSKYYIHHVISIILFFILCALIDVHLGSFNAYKEEFSPSFFFQPLTLLIDATTICFEKYMIFYKYHSPWNIVFAIGLFTFILNCGTLTLTLSKRDEYKILEPNPDFFGKFYKYFSEIPKALIILKFILNYILEFSHHLLKILTLVYFTPNHLLISLEISKLFTTIMYVKETNDDNTKAKIRFPIILFILVFFTLLIYLEIIELNFWGLNANTKKNIQKREIKEMLLSEPLDDRIDEFPLDELETGYYLNTSDGNQCPVKELNDLGSDKGSIIY